MVEFELERTLFKVGWALHCARCYACIASHLYGERAWVFKRKRLPRKDWHDVLENGGREVWLRFPLQKSRGRRGCSATGSRPSTGRDTHLEPFQLATPCNAMHAAFMAAIRDWGPTIRRRNFVLIGLSFDGGTARFLQPWRLFSGSLTGQNTEASRSRPRLSFVNHFPDPDTWESGRLSLNDN